MAAVLLPAWVYVGGDVYEERFLLVLYPAGFVALLRLTAGHRLQATAAAAFIALQVLTIARTQFVAWPKYDQFLALGEFLRDRYPPETTLAVDGAGKVPYATRMASLDMLGLNDAAIGRAPSKFFVVGHNKYDAAYVMERRPDLICAWVDLGAARLDSRLGPHGGAVRGPRVPRPLPPPYGAHVERARHPRRRRHGPRGRPRPHARRLPVRRPRALSTPKSATPPAKSPSPKSSVRGR